MKKRILLYLFLLGAGLFFVIYTFQLKHQGLPPEESINASAGTKKNHPPGKNPGSILPHFDQEFVSYKGELTLRHDTGTPNLWGATKLDGFGFEEIADFRIRQVSLYRQLGIYEKDYHPLKSYHLDIYKQITPGKEWLGPTPYYIANPYQLVILTCANHVTPLNLYCPGVGITYKDGVFEAIHRGEAAFDWFRRVYSPDTDFPGQVWAVTVNAYDAGFFYVYADLALSENVKSDENPDYISNTPRSFRYFYHVGRYGKNNLSPTHRLAWLTLKNRDTRTVIHFKLWRNEPVDKQQKPDLVWIFRILGE